MNALEERLKKLFPEIIFDGDEATWKGGEYVAGYKNSLQLDGDFTSEMLRALVDWMDSK